MSEIEQLKMENERLHSHHSGCKERMAHEIEIANKWRIRAYVAEKLLKYLNKLNPFWFPEDLHKEIKMQTTTMFEQWKHREAWWN